MNINKGSDLLYYAAIGVVALAAIVLLSWLIVKFVMPVLFFIAAFGWIISALNQ